MTHPGTGGIELAAYETLQLQKQKVTAQFLEAELGLVRTFLDTAQLSKVEEHTEHYEAAKRRASDGIATIRRFVDQIDSASAKAKIYRRLQVLDDIIASL